jgi:hypothetical protein
LDEMAGALGLGAAQMIAAAAQDRCLSSALAIMAFRQEDTAVARQAYEAIPEAQPWLLLPLLQSVEKLQPITRQELAEYLVRKDLSAGIVNQSLLAHVHRALNGPISEGLMEEILRAPVWPQWSASPQGYYTAALDPIAALCPSAKRPALRQVLAQFQTAQPLLQFLDMLDSLEKVSPRE